MATNTVIRTTHGHARNSRHTPEYAAWASMRQRCLNPKNPKFKRYGARGIRVCETWTLSFAAFLADMGPRPAGTTLDRIDNDGNYEPGNCRWATRKRQQRNMRRNRFLTHNGVTMTMADWADALGMPYRVLCSRISKKGWEVGRALTQPYHATTSMRG